MKEVMGRKLQGTVSPCAACKLLRRRCTQDCLFAPYFPADEPLKFANVHKVFGASNVNKLLQELPVQHRSDAVSSMVYEANARVRDPVYGCVAPSPPSSTRSTRSRRSSRWRRRDVPHAGAARRSARPPRRPVQQPAEPDWEERRHHHYTANTRAPGLRRRRLRR
ncbi:LOB domain-containing protein 4 [Iris pallida]|uniref:LOB domain-containing protein 4 n=1 Tax=Iris pallida TaxID=29817 RepID=A0AAX6I1C0_IRIPA|nr:LOB domain-containing protein 4 [Iris pallida]